MKKTVNLIISYGFTAIFLALSLYVIHDVQTAEGVGFYFNIKTGLLSRAAFDIIADAILFILLIILILVPVFVYKSFKIGDFLRFLLLFISFMPSKGIGYFISLFNDKNVYALSPDYYVLFLDFSYYFKVLIPLFVLLAGLVSVIKGLKLGKGVAIPVLLAIFLFLALIPFKGLYTLSQYVVTYLILIAIFKTTESVKEKLWPLNAFLVFVSLYRIIEVCEAFSL